MGMYCHHCNRVVRPGQGRMKNNIPSWCFTFKTGKKRSYMSTSHRCTNLKGDGKTGNLKRSFMRSYKSSKGRDCPAGCKGLCVEKLESYMARMSISQMARLVGPAQ